MSQHLDHVLRKIAVVKKVVAHGNRLFQTPDVVRPVRRYQQRIAWFDDAFVGRRRIEEGEALEIRLFWIDLPAIQKIPILWRKQDGTLSASNLSQISMRTPVVAME